MNCVFVALALMTICIHPSKKETVPLPPPEFDRPYNGKLILRNIDTQKGMQKACEDERPDIVIHGCQWEVEDLCYIAIYSKLGPKDYSRTLRHEIGHCNGWPGDHPNARWD